MYPHTFVLFSVGGLCVTQGHLNAFIARTFWTVKRGVFIFAIFSAATILTLRALTLGKSVHASSKNERISSRTTEKILDLCTDMWPDELDSDGS